MREIKFRAWDSYHKKMYSAEELGEDQLTLSVDGRGFVNIHGGDRSLSQFYNHIIPMQSTGLHDKNGKEIYEGDIVKVPCGWGGDNEYDECLAEVQWDFDEASFRLNNPKDKYGLVMQDWSWMYLEVIGNIHENPELLKGGDDEQP